MTPKKTLTKTSKHIAPVLLGLALLCGRPEATIAAPTPQSAASEAEFFKNQILPIFAARCQSCHNHTLKLSGLSLESATGFNTGGIHGPVVVPGNPQQSRLYRRVARLEKPFMPMEQDALPDAEVALLKRWIEQGAVWPTGIGSSAPSATEVPADLAALSANARLFREKIHPILSTRCGSCHNDERKYSGFTLETRSGFLSGGWHGPVVVSGKPDQSRLYRRVARLEKTYMPMGISGGPGEPLPAAELALIKEWIEGGAEWPEDPQSREAERARQARLKDLQKLEDRPVTEEERRWWSFVPPVRRPVPTVKNFGPGEKSHRRVCFGQPGSKGTYPGSAGFASHADPPRLSRSDRNAASPRGGRGFRKGSDA